MSCSTCFGLGTYQDPRCEEKTCAHAIREVLESKQVPVYSPYKTDSDKNDKPIGFRTIVIKRGKRRMACPVRICGCSAGQRLERTAKSP